MSVAMPFSLSRWIEDNRHLLKPPVGNKAIFNGDFLVMIIGGPNARTDYHVNPGEELFYQIEGDITLKIIEDGRFRDVPIRQGEMFLLPARVPHSPRRPADTIGLVVETPKAYRDDHFLQWFCLNCQAKVHEFAFKPVDLGAQIQEMLGRFRDDESLRTCQSCGAVYPAS